ncbi:MAG TPA: hypothetical protein VFB16_03195 [Bauldia sp.]|nr:hypothetical protein [Bauldia sp.]
MPSAKSAFGVIGALLPVFYCGGLLYYFLDTAGSVKDAEDIGLGPTLLGLAVLGLLFCIPLVWKVVRMFRGPRAPGANDGDGPDAPAPGGEGSLRADEVIARYLALRSTEAGQGPAASDGNGGPRQGRPTFGRRTR